MAQTLTAEVPARITLSGTAGLVTTLTLPQGTFYLRLRWISGTYGYVTRTIADGADKSTVYETYDSGTVYSIATGSRGASGLIGLASDTNSGVVEVTALPGGK